MFHASIGVFLEELQVELLQTIEHADNLVFLGQNGGPETNGKTVNNGESSLVHTAQFIAGAEAKKSARHT